ncbi:STAS domain-containing protein [Sansalvadorimonas sp. 2012CJ34-2]|uniref:STAS domain-containing protein n=1 Tax=Parendozoicomonas callyspongiae TaxID=2942213 RepID=A0ABT0PC68_9GAMM|nr:STAS domain-containing protein [Sansalvadorimonas sp. 2012CJ34-2]MCL6268883.1 STAS domain-containing protein [Sansalvadorimonas sp. 2012CJ34-2]
MTAGLSPVKPGRFVLSGDVDVWNTPVLVEQGWQLLVSQEEKELVIDMSAIGQADSSALAMLLSWLRRAKGRQMRLSFCGFSQDLMALAKVCDIESMLPIIPSENLG